MSNQGIRGFYQLTETIKNELLKNVDVNTVTTGTTGKKFRKNSVSGLELCR